MLTDLIEVLSRIGGDLLSWILWMNLWAAAILVLIVLSDRLLASRVSAGWRLALYGVIALRLVMPVQWNSPLGVPRHVDQGAMVGASISTGDVGTLATENAMTVAARSAEGAGAEVDGALVAIILMYAIVAVGFLVRWIIVRRRAAADINQAEPASASIQELGGAYPVLLHERLGPLALGVFNPRIVLPRRLARSMDRRSLAWIVRHEATHLRRRDQLLLAAVQLACIAAWPIAAVWIAARRVRDLIEIACDEAVLRQADDQTRRAYGRTLLDVAEQLRPNRVVAPIGVPWGSSVARRVACIASPRRWPAAVQVAAVFTVAIGLTACSTTSNRSVAKTRAGQDESTATAAAAHPDAAQVHVSVRVCAVSQELMKLIPPTSDDNPTATMSAEAFERFLAALERDDASSILSAPSLITNDGRQATITIGELDGEGLQLGVVPTVKEAGVLLQLDYAENFADQPRIAGTWDVLVGKLVVTLLVFEQPGGAPHRVIAVTSSIL